MNNNGDIPDHSIQCPFGTTDEMKSRHERFEKYRYYIVPAYKKIFNDRLGCGRGYTCPECSSYVSNRACRMLAHLASLKHLRAALGDELHESDKRNSRRVSSKHRIDASGTIVDSVVGDVTSGLGEDGK